MSTLEKLLQYKVKKNKLAKYFADSDCRSFVLKYRPNQLIGTYLKNKYFIMSILGFGGMSIVYKAKNIENKSYNAIKCLKMTNDTDDLIIKRFQREAQTLNKLNHPAIVKIYDYGVTKFNQPFFVMDILKGETLEELLATTGKLKPKFIKDIFLQVCDALDHAHKSGIIHRDLKPANIILIYDKDHSKFQVKIFDFGIARLSEDNNKLTKMGEVWGSPIYMSPEQCMGAELDSTSDIYSIATVIYECLTGQVPHIGKNFADTMSKKFKDPIIPPSEINPEGKISQSLDNVIMRALSKIPHDRHESMAQFMDDLNSAIQVVNYKDSFIPYRELKQSKTMLQPVKKNDNNKYLVILLILFIAFIAMMAVVFLLNRN